MQDEEDLNAENLTEYEIEIGKDTIIGVFQYNTLRVKYNWGVMVWKSKLNN